MQKIIKVIIEDDTNLIEVTRLLNIGWKVFGKPTMTKTQIIYVLEFEEKCEIETLSPVHHFEGCQTVGELIDSYESFNISKIIIAKKRNYKIVFNKKENKIDYIL